MSIALDIGVSRIRSLRRNAEGLVFRRVRPVYAVLPDSDSYRDMLARMPVPYAICDDALLMFGEPAADFSRLFQTPFVDLLPDGKIPDDDPPARQLLAAMIEALLPEPNTPNELCCLTLPGNPDTFAARRARRLTLLTHLVSLRGYTPLIISSARALILAELVAESFTGIGLVFGAGSCDISICRQGQEIAHCCVPRGGNWIDEQMALRFQDYSWDSAGNRYLDIDGITCWKESLDRSRAVPETEREMFLAKLNDQLIDRVLSEVARLCVDEAVASEVGRPIGVIADGGPLLGPGTADRLRRAVRKTEFPFDIGAVRTLADSDETIVRGCLINAELEDQSSDRLRAA